MSRPTQFHHKAVFVYWTITIYGVPFHALLLTNFVTYGLVPFRSPLLRESRLISFPLGTKMFQFPRFASTPYVFRCGYSLKENGFPHSEISGSKFVYQLTEAYRRLPRPSSPLVAKASAACTYSLDHITSNNLHCLLSFQVYRRSVIYKIC